MPVQSKLDQSYAQGRGSADRVLEGAGAFAWSISWPQLKLIYVSPSSQALLGSDALSPSAGERITEAIWSSAIELDGGGSAESLVAELWTKGYSQFRFDYTSSSGQLSRFDCRAVLVRDATERPLRIDGIAVLQSQGTALGSKPPGLAHRLSDVRFLAFRVDCSMRVLDWHTTVEMATGITAAEAVGASILDLLDSESLEGVGNLVESLKSGFPLVCKLRGQQVIMQTVVDRSSGLAENERLVIATAFRKPEARISSVIDSGATGAGRATAENNPNVRSAFAPLLDCSLEHIVVVDAGTLKVVGASRAAQHALGFGPDKLAVLPIEELSTELHELVTTQKDYLAEGCLLAAVCSIRGLNGSHTVAEARVRYWEAPGEGLFIINVRQQSEIADGPRERTASGEIGTLLIDTNGNCQVLSAADATWLELLHEGAEGKTLGDLAKAGESLDGSLRAALAGRPAELTLNCMGRSVFCRLEPIRNDGSAVAGLLGMLRVGP